jgi:hypothetical protein
VVGRSAVVLENRGDCRSRQERLTCPAPGRKPRTARRAQPLPSESRERRGARSRPGGGKAQGTVAGVLRRASGAERTCRGKAPRADNTVSLDGATADSALPIGLDGPVGTKGVRGSSFERCARPRTPLQRGAAPVRCSSLRVPRGRASQAGLKLETRRQPPSPPRPTRGAARREARLTKESSGLSGARTEGRLHSSRRGIFPSRRARLQR